MVVQDAPAGGAGAREASPRTDSMVTSSNAAGRAWERRESGIWEGERYTREDREMDNSLRLALPRVNFGGVQVASVVLVADLAIAGGGGQSPCDADRCCAGPRLASALTAPVGRENRRLSAAEEGKLHVYG